jgi:hypothetical protein
MTSFFNILAENPEQMAKARELAETFNDEKLSPTERMLAAIQLSDLASAATLEATKRDVIEAIRKANEPRYEFRRGAKVRIK